MNGGIPIIDLAPLLSGKVGGEDKIVCAIGEILENVGFFHLMMVVKLISILIGSSLFQILLNIHLITFVQAHSLAKNGRNVEQTKIHIQYFTGIMNKYQ